jgi:hypothetical protein
MITVTTAVVVVVAATAGNLATSTSRSCGTLRSGGATWTVVAAGVPCGSAKPLVRRLATKPHPSVATRLGTHLGLTCVEFAGQAKLEIACVSRDGRRSVYGVTKEG